MNTAPITSWEGAEVYYTWAGTPAIGVLVALGVVVCAYTIWAMVKHENHAAKKHG